MKENVVALIVDDNPSDALVTRFILEKNNHAAMVAQDAFQAIELVSNVQFKLILVDLQMPKMSGIELIKRIRRMELGKNVPIITVSGRNTMVDVKSAIQAGANDYIVKPIDPEIITNKLVQIGALSTENWFEYSVPSEKLDNVMFVLEQQSLSTINEVQFSYVSNVSKNEHDIISFKSGLFERFGLNDVVGRVIKCSNKGAHFLIRCTYVGLTEEQRQKIRIYCREVWVKQENQNAVSEN